MSSSSACRWLFAARYGDQLWGASVSLPPSVPRRWGPVTRSQVHNPPSGLRRTPHVLMALLMRDPELRMVTWLFLFLFLPVCTTMMD